MWFASDALCAWTDDAGGDHRLQSLERLVKALPLIGPELQEELQMWEILDTVARVVAERMPSP